MKIAIIPVTPFHQNCALIWNEATGQAAVIDPGGDVPRILDAVAQHGARVERIVLTHGHLDHAGGAAALRAALPGAPPIEGPGQRDQFLLDGIADQARQYGIPGLDNAQPDRWLAEGDTVDLAGAPFAVLHCPGHTPGHVVLFNAEARFAFVGDVLFRGSVGRTDFPYGSEADLLDSIRTKLLPLGDDVAFLCGHGPGSTIGEERRTNPFLRR